MAKKATAYYDIKIKLENPASTKWIKVGFGTAMEGEFGPIIACTVESIPLELIQNGFNKWNGEFYLMMKKQKEKEADDANTTE